jgi:hypothetical protein
VVSIVPTTTPEVAEEGTFLSALLHPATPAVTSDIRQPRQERESHQDEEKPQEA